MIIAFTGYKGSGKTEAAEHLIRAHGFTRVSFAYPLKQSVAALLEIHTPIIESWKNDPDLYVCVERFEHGGAQRIVKIPFRKFLQNYGTEAHRDVMGDNFWVDLWIQKALGTHCVVVDDCRFPNEAEAILYNGGQIVRIDRPGVEGGADTHQSERPLDDVYVSNVIANDGSLEQLYRAVDCLL